MREGSVKKILCVAHSGSQGGAELCLDTLLGHLDRSRFQAAVVFAWDGPMVESARGMGYPVEVEPLARWLAYDPGLWQWKNVLAASWSRVWRLVRRIRRERVDLVYTNTAVIYEGAFAAWLAGVPHVWHVHEVLTPEHMAPCLLPLGLIGRLIGRLSARVVFESDAARAIGAKWIAREKCLTVYNAVRFGAREEERGERGEGQEERDEKGDAPHPGPLPEGEGRVERKRCVVAWVGRLSARKNPLMLVRAITQMKEAEQTEFVFAGEGPLETELREAIGRHGLQHRCRLLPFQEDIRPLLAECDVLVLTSQEESFGLVLVEAGAYGKPVVATRTQGPREIVVDGQTGFLVTPNDDAELAARLEQLVADADLRQAMGQAGAARVAKQFSAEQQTRKIEAIIEGLCNRRS